MRRIKSKKTEKISKKFLFIKSLLQQGFWKVIIKWKRFIKNALQGRCKRI